MNATPPKPAPKSNADNAHLEALGYSGTDFHRSMSLWSNIALGFTYLSPLVGVYSLFAYSLSIGGPPAFWWILIVGCGQFLVALVFGEVVSQYPIAGGIYPWTRRLWGRRYAWMVSWIYLWAVIVTVTAVAEFGGGFVAALFGVELTPIVELLTAVTLLVVALLINFSGTQMLARIAKIGLVAELVGVVALGVFLLLFKRANSFSVFFDSEKLAAAGAREPRVAAVRLVAPLVRTLEEVTPDGYVFRTDLRLRPDPSGVFIARSARTRIAVGVWFSGASSVVWASRFQRRCRSQPSTASILPKWP